MHRLNVAILGQGRSGLSIHGKYLLTDKERFRVVAVVDALAERRQKAENLFGCDTYSDYRELLERRDIDLVVNAFYSADHYPVTLELLRRGFNVLVEKPAARDPEQLDEMVRAADDAGKVLAFFQQSRYAPYYVRIKKILESGVLGRIAQISIAFDGFSRRWDWQTIQANMAGSLYNTGPHPVDQALDLLGGEEIPGVFCKMDRVLTFGDAEDYVKLILTLPGKPLIDLSISSCNAYPSGIYNIQGQYGGLWSDLNTVKCRWYAPDEAPKQHLIHTSLTAPNGEPAYCTEELPWVECTWETAKSKSYIDYATEAFYKNLHAHIVDGEPMLVTAAQVRRQLAVIRRCHEMNPMP